MPVYDSLPWVSTEYSYRGIEATYIENEHLRIMLLPGKGGDILEFRNKRKGVNVLWNAQHEWNTLDTPYPLSDPETAWLNYYPGGWQMNLPVAGMGREIPGTEYGLHGETALIPWEVAETHQDEDRAEVTLETSLVQYPFSVRRTFRLPASTPELEIEAEVSNNSRMDLEYTWQEHIALGKPLISEETEIDVPAERGLVESDSDAFPNGRLKNGESFQWPAAPGRDGSEIDLRSVPSEDSEIHDLAFALELSEDRYTVSNPSLDLGFTFEFPTDLFESVWYWQAFNGHMEAPFYGRNYNIGLEPTTGYPMAAEERRANGSMKLLEAGETKQATFTASVFGGVEES
jgi:galactose mutarotase-like enzyme